MSVMIGIILVNILMRESSQQRVFNFSVNEYVHEICVLALNSLKPVILSSLCKL